MDKIIYSGDQDELLRRCGGVLWTLVESDSHIKRASSDAITEKLIRDNMPDKNHFLVHYIAMGSGEHYGFNRNGDYFPEKALRDRHDTFVKHGHFFREHANRDPKKKIGDIKASAWNDAMKRVELIIHGHKEKAAKEYAEAKAGKDLDGSMSCRVPYDVCSCCKNKAKSSKNYCVDLRSHMTQYRPKYSKFAYAINDEPTFFDQSAVENHADRIARHLEVRFHDDEEMKKAASATSFQFSDELATEAGILLPEPIHKGCYDSVKQQWLTKLASMEDFINKVADDYDNVAKDEKYYFLKHAAVHAFPNVECCSEDQLKELRRINPDILFRHLSKQAALIPFHVFAAYIENVSIKEASDSAMINYAHQKYLPTMFRDLGNSQSDSKLEDMFDPASHYKSACLTHSDAQIKQATEGIVKHCSLAWKAWKNRMLIGAVESGGKLHQVKIASAEPGDEVKLKAKNLALAYAMYKVAFVTSVSNLIGEEFLDEPTLLLIASQNRN